MSWDPGIANTDLIMRRAPGKRAVPFGATLVPAFAAGIVSLAEAVRATIRRRTQTDQGNEHSTLLRWRPLGAKLRAARPRLNSYAGHPDCWGRPNHLHA